MAYFQSTANQGMRIETLLHGVQFDWRYRLAGLQRRFPSAGLTACGIGLVVVLALAIPAEIRLLMVCAGLFLIGAGGLAVHGWQRWNRFCDDVAHQAYTQPWRHGVY